jgi:hypothetical protein
MSNLLKYLYIEHDLKKKKKFSEPKIYDANGDLSKRWYVYFSFRKVEEGPLERFPNNIYAPQNLDKKERIEWLNANSSDIDHPIPI